LGPKETEGSPLSSKALPVVQRMGSTSESIMVHNLGSEFSEASHAVLSAEFR
jgi:hypothetical protein